MNAIYSEVKFVLKEGDYSPTKWNDYDSCPTYCDIPYPLTNDSFNLCGMLTRTISHKNPYIGFYTEHITCSGVDIHDHGIGFNIDINKKHICFSLYEFDKEVSKALKLILE